MDEKLVEIERGFARRFTLYVVGRNFEDALASTAKPAVDADGVMKLLETRRAIVGDDVSLGVWGFDVYADNESYNWKA